MSTLSLLGKLFIFSVVLFIFGQLFGTCLFPDGGKYPTRLTCVEKEWERKVSNFIHILSDEAEDRVKDEIYENTGSIKRDDTLDF